MNRAEHREWLRIRLAIRTPLEQWKELQSLGLDPGERPLQGDWPSWSPEPSNHKLEDAIRNACRTVNRKVNLSGTSVREVDITAQTADGPYAVELGSLIGYPPRSVLTVRRAWWNDGTTNTKLTARVLGDLDRRGQTYLENAVGTPYEYWLEGYTLWLDRGPSAAGTLKLVVGDGLLAPEFDNEGFDPIPESYDPSVLYLAIVELCKMMPNDREMISRAQAYLPDAADAMKDLEVWFNGGNSEQAEPSFMFDARFFRGRR